MKRRKKPTVTLEFGDFWDLKRRANLRNASVDDYQKILGIVLKSGLIDNNMFRMAIEDMGYRIYLSEDLCTAKGPRAAIVKK